MSVEIVSEPNEYPLAFHDLRYGETYQDDDGDLVFLIDTSSYDDLPPVSALVISGRTAEPAFLFDYRHSDNSHYRFRRVALGITVRPFAPTVNVQSAGS